MKVGSSSSGPAREGLRILPVTVHSRRARPSATRPPRPDERVRHGLTIARELARHESAAACFEDRCRGGCSLGHPFDPVFIPHDSENRGVATRIDQERNPQVSGTFQRSPRSRNRPGSTSQGRDTGSNPLATTSPNVQVTGQVWGQIRPRACDLLAADPANFPRPLWITSSSSGVGTSIAS